MEISNSLYVFASILLGVVAFAGGLVLIFNGTRVISD